MRGRLSDITLPSCLAVRIGSPVGDEHLTRVGRQPTCRPMRALMLITVSVESRAPPEYACLALSLPPSSVQTASWADRTEPLTDISLLVIGSQPLPSMQIHDTSVCLPLVTRPHVESCGGCCPQLCNPNQTERFYSLRDRPVLLCYPLMSHRGDLLVHLVTQFHEAFLVSSY